MNKQFMLSFCALAVLGACAKRSDEISANYVSPMQFSSYSCNQLAAEGRRVSSQAAEAAGVQDANANSDAAMMGVGMFLFWPSLFFINGDGENAAELSRLKGEMQAIEVAGNQKSCGFGA